MLCSPSHLFIDLTIWYSDRFYDSLVATGFENASRGDDDYDCGLVSAPCVSNITRALVSFDTSVFYWFDVLVVYCLLTLVVVAGVVGNIVNIVIFSTTKIASDSTNSLLLALSVSDLCNLSTIAIMIVNCFLCFVDTGLALTTYNVSFPQISVISRWFSLLSLDLVAVISIQRAAAVVFPFKVAAMFSQRNTNIVIGGLMVLTVGSMLVANVAFYPLWIFHPYFEKTISLGHGSRLDYLIVTEYITLYLSSRSAIDLFVISVTGTLTVIHLKTQARSRALMKSNTGSASESKTSARESNAIKMSLTVCFVTFVIYTLVILANGVLQFLYTELFKTPLPIMNMYSILVLNAVGASFNFFLYLVMSPKYIDLVKQCFRCKDTSSSGQ